MQTLIALLNELEFEPSTTLENYFARSKFWKMRVLKTQRFFFELAWVLYSDLCRMYLEHLVQSTSNSGRARPYQGVSFCLQLGFRRRSITEIEKRGDWDFICNSLCIATSYVTFQVQKDWQFLNTTLKIFAKVLLLWSISFLQFTFWSNTFYFKLFCKICTHN